MNSGARRPTWQLALVAAGALLTALLAGVLGTAHYSAKRSAAFCTSCHLPSENAHVLAKGHENQTCQSCHSVETDEAVRLAAARLIGTKSARGHTRVSATACTQCHNSRDAAWTRIATTSGHQSHPSGVGALDCLSCHRESAHGQKPIANVCADCHARSKLHRDKEGVAEGKQPQCLSCHNFSLPKEGKVQLTADACARCHGEAARKGKPAAEVLKASVVKEKDLHGDVDCKLCHQPHAGHGGLPMARNCTNCHSILITDTGKLPEEHLVCQKCHEQHKPLKKAGSQCAGCHEQARRGAKAASTALQHDECASCHRPHTWVAEMNGCVNCHVEEASLVSTKSPERHQRCVNCHEVHGPPPSGLTTCAGCHKLNANRMQAAPMKHRDCTSCHNPHAPHAEAPRACAECHKAPVHQLVSVGPATHARAGCTACHTLHGNPRADSRACQNCHKGQRALVAKAGPEPHRDCASCHRPHRFAVSNPTQPCRRCHEKMVTASTAHSGTCNKCHQPHGSPLVQRAKCLNCHAKLNFSAPNATHDRCSSCHTPHQRAQGTTARCANCHQDKVKVAQLWPAHSAHRDSCTGCHQPHAAQNKKACADCHQKQATMSSGGKHRCTQCHSPHAAPPGSTAGWWSKCSGCHAKQAEASKGHSACNNCHKPHSFSPPACTTCHKAAASKAAHKVKEHQACTKCHDAHGATLPGRQECLACHTDRTNHQPNAGRCQGCHLFK
ncbi:MAG: cytochrome c3 family protein [Polyangiaceae bacterium]